MRLDEFASKRQLDEIRIRMPVSRHMDIARKDMPQVDTKHFEALIDFFQAQGYEVTEEVVDPNLLRPVQNEFSKAGVVKSIQKVHKKGYIKKPSVISNDNYIMDGHHRWLAAINTGKDMPVYRIDAPVKELFKMIMEFPDSYTKDIYEDK